MNKNRSYPASADPASPEPSTARAESCTCCGGGREPDPTDDNMRALRRLRDFALAVAENLMGQIVGDAVPDAAAPAAVDDAPDAPDEAPKPDASIPAMVLAFQRAERGVRQSILLSQKLYDDRLARDKQADATAASAEKKQYERRKKHVKRLVKEAIERDTEDSDEEFECLQKLDARLDEEDIERDLGRIADSAIIARLCKDCGVEPPWALWGEENWAVEEVLVEPTGSVFVELARAAPPEAAAEAVEPVAAEPPQDPPGQAAMVEVAVSAAEPPGAAPPTPEPEDPYEARMKARLATAMRSGAWMTALQMDGRLAEYVRKRLTDSS